jgi:sugar transferase EpsL
VSFLITQSCTSSLGQINPNLSYLHVKKSLDRLLSVLLIALLSPVLLVIYFLTLYKLGPPALYFQVRPGMHGVPFSLCKFRTMSAMVDANGSPLPDHLRLTRFGIWLRSTSLDELPSIFNILLGDMSFIGPRPLLVQYLELYSPDQARRHDVMPGLTGWAQINGRNAISWEEKFRLDVWYVDHQSFLLDLRIFLFTIWKVIRRQGISAAGEATMSPFTGSAISE